MSSHSGRHSSASARPRFLALLLASAIIFSALPRQFAPIIPSAHAASPDIVISQVYGGGGNAGATLKNDFIELFNRGTSPVTVTGWSVQYAASTGTSWQKTDLTGTIQPGRYYLVQEAAGTGGTVSLPAPDAGGASAGIPMAAGAGKVALVTNQVPLTCGTANNCLPNAAIKDFVGFGTGTNSFEGSGPTPTLTNTTAAIRAGGGCTDTDSNPADFAVGAPAPRNSASTANPCGVVANNPPTINAPSNPAATVNQDAAPFAVSLSGNDDNAAYTWAATVGTGVSAVTVTSGQNTPNVTYTVTLQAGFTGTATFTASLSDGVNTPATTRAVNIAVNPVVVANDPPAIAPPANPAATVAQDAAPFAVSLSGSDDFGVYNWAATPGAGVSSATVTAGQGTAAATYRVTLVVGFSGTAKFTATLSDGVNAPTTQVVNITVTPAPPPPLDHIVINQVYGGGGNTGATFHNDFVELYNPTTSDFDLGGWTIQYGSATGTTWQVQPLGGIMQPGQHYLISLASGGNVGAALPAANVTGDINMSATAGKVALSNGGDPFDGCPVGDSTLVDLVGFGTANCREGGTNAPAGSNTSAIFRKNGGFTDTNVNGADFVTGSPTPRRETPITEIGPYVLNVDPRSTATNAPHDASITATFTEPVQLDPAWFDINCAVTGSHNDATVAGAGRIWVVTPNTNFEFGEQCTAKVFKGAVHDVDLDDSEPGSDTLKADYSWTFKVTGAGAPAPYPRSVHLTMGNPTDAVADLNQPDNYLMEKDGYTLSYNRSKGTPNWVSWHLDNSWYGTLARVDSFRPDPAVPSDWYRVQATDYFASGFDRGHMTPNADRDHQDSIPRNQETFLMSNMVPQSPDNNQGPWADFENELRRIADLGNELYIVSGPAGVGGFNSVNGQVINTIAGGHVTVPASTWKVVLVIPKADGDDVARTTAAARTIAINIPNVQGIRNDDWTKYLTTVDAVEQLSHYDFFENLPDAVENSIEAGTNGTNPPGTQGQSVTTAEDTAATFTLTAVSPKPNPTFAYTVNGPSHGTLTGTGASRTYTPAPDFSGTDSFTFSVNDGQANSNTSTVSITVTDVNDAPVAGGDSKSTQEDTALSFLAGELLINDSAGAANEGGQTLAVTSVSGGADTHGAVSFAGGQITYTPAANYHGAASFTYEVCDDGTTSGSLDAKCATGTVNLTVEPVNDSPEARADEATTDEDTPVTIDVVANDTDVDGDAPTLESVSDATHGTVTMVGGKAVFTPAANYNGAASFTYVLSDGHGGTGTGGVSITINPVNDAPALESRSEETNEDTAKSFTLAGTDPDGDSLTYSVVAPPAHGTASVSGSSVTYTPEANFHGADSFTLKANDGTVDSAEATVTLTVNAVNDAPSASAQNVATDEDTPKQITLVGTDVETPGSSLAFSVTVQPSHGHFSGSAPNLTYVPDANYNGGDSFEFTVTDGGDESSAATTSAPATVSITINPTNDAPTLSGVPASATINELAAYTFTASAGDVDTPAQTLTFSLVGAPSGAFIDPATGAFSWTPTEAQGGTNVPSGFKVKVSDGVADAFADIVITVSEVNQAPTLDAIGSKSVDLGGSLSFNAAGHDGDLPAQGLSYSLTGAPAGATIDQATGAFSWTPTAAQAGHVYTFGVRVTDNGSPALYAEEQISVGVAYTWTGALSPLDAGGGSVFKSGRIVPVKFSLTGASAGITNATIRLRLFQLVGGVAGAELPVNSNPSAGNLFHFDGEQYHLNWDTTGLPAGTYQLRIDAGDGFIRAVNVTIS
jgi:DNA/RNA endonuclease G (NUC1)